MTTQKNRRTISNRFAWTMAAGLLLVASGHAASTTEGYQDGAPLADERASYSFLRTIEGDATIASNGEGVGSQLEVNQPLLTGDLVRVGPGSRLEIALSDRNRLYLDAETGVSLERIAFSGDREERVTVLRLEGGELILLVSEEALGDELPSVITANATVYIQQPGEYRVEAGIENNGESWTRVVTRSGYAEIVTNRGSSVVREGEAILAQGDQRVRLAVASADDPDALEGWTAGLNGRALATSRSAQYVEPQLAYDAAPLDDAGNWVEYESVRYWRPYVSAGWRPYTQGRWGWTPSGYTWISYEPWGWVPYHYGRWCSLPGYGWAWRPGAVYSPAWVYWNWTSGYAAWVPMGYYSHFYDPWYGGGFRYGVYGWAGGGWGIYSDWNFAPVHCFRDRNFRGHIRNGRDFQRESRLSEPPRGLLTTDTRDFRPDRLDRTDRTEDLLHQIGKRNRTKVDQDLPDVTDFVGRKGKLPTDVARAIARKDPKDPGVMQDIGRLPKVAETPDWKKQDPTRSGDFKDRSGFKEPPVLTGGKVGSDVRDRSNGADPSKPGAAGPKPDRPAKVSVQDSKPSIPQAKVPVHESKPSGPQAKAPVSESKPSGPQVKGPAYESRRSDPQAKMPVYESQEPLPAAKPREIGKPGLPQPALPSGGDNRQQWKAKGGDDAPVQRVVGSVRRASPGGDPTSAQPGQPRSGGSKEGGFNRPTSPTSPSSPSAKSPSGSQPYRPSGNYGKGSSTSNDSPAAPGSGSYSKVPQTGQRGSQGSADPGKGTGGYRAQSPQEGSTYGKSPSSGNRDSQGDSSFRRTPSTGTQGSQGGSAYGKSPSSAARGTQGSQGSSSYGKGSSDPQGSQGSPAYRRGSSGSQGSSGYSKGPSGGSASPQGSSSYGKGPSAGSAKPQGASSYGKSPAPGASSSQGSSSHGRSSAGSTGSGGSASARGSQGSGKGSAASDSRGSGKSSSSSKGQSSPPPPESKSGDGGH